jgi:hypothetical protein
MSAHLMHDCCNREVWIGGNSYENNNDNSSDMDNDNYSKNNHEINVENYDNKNPSIKMLSDDFEGIENNTRILKFSDKNTPISGDGNMSVNLKSMSSRTVRYVYIWIYVCGYISMYTYINIIYIYKHIYLCTYIYVNMYM